MTGVLEAAIDWHNHGYTVIPARDDGSKAPAAEWREWMDHQPPADTVIGWAATAHGIGVVCGGAMHLEMLEVEGRAAGTVTQVAQLAADNGMADLWHTVANGYAESTPSGGLHYYYRAAGEARRNTKLARDAARNTLWETRGVGGFSIIAPSGGPVHPTGRPWQVIAGHPANIPILADDDRDALHALIAMLDTAPPQAEPPAPTSPMFTTPNGGGLRPGDDYANRTDWADILTGWTRVRRMGSGWAWRRPGKREGISATTGQAADGIDRLYVFSSSTEFPTETPISKFGAYTLLNHGGDHRAAARHLATQGYGTPRPQLTVVPPPRTAEGEAAAEGDGQPAPTGALASRIDWHTAYATESEHVDWLVDGLIERGRLIALYSAPKAGKSLVALDMAASLATGRAVLGAPPTGEIVPILYCDWENTPGDVVDRLRDLGYDDPGELAELHYLSLPATPPLDTTAGGAQILEAALTVKAEMVIIDTASRTISGPENDADTWTSWYQATGIALKRAGIALLRLDHSGKDEKRGQRGSSAKSGDVDLVLHLVADGNHLDLIAEQKRQGHYIDRLHLFRTEVDGRLTHVPSTPVEAANEQARQLVQWLDTHGVPQDAGRPAVTKLLADSGKRVSKRTVEAALRIRRGGLTANGAGQARKQTGQFGTKA